MYNYTSTLQQNYRTNETELLLKYKNYLQPNTLQLQNAQITSYKQALNYRKTKLTASSTDMLISKYPLSSSQGFGIMGLAESLIRTPDKHNRYKLLADKICNRNWLVKAFSVTLLFYSLSLSFAKILLKNYNTKPNIIQKMLLPFIDKMACYIIQKIAKQFVAEQSIQLAVAKINKNVVKNVGYSFDMLGEAAKTTQDANKYFNEYINCINTISKYNNNCNTYGVSVKLSSLSPHFNAFNINHAFNSLYTKILHLCNMCAKQNIGLFIDAEEANTTEFTIKIFAKLLTEDSLKNWQGLGIVVQAYQKRAFDIITVLYNLAQQNNKKIVIRLVKGAYWDTEIKQDQANGVSDFSVFTRKEHTDVSYMACAKKLASYTNYIKPCFATHNIYTINFINNLMANQPNTYEFQALYGMGEDVYKNANITTNLRLYTPVGSFKDLLPYLVRRLLENGAKSNFISAIVNTQISIKQIIENPLSKASKHGFSSHWLVRKPKDIFITENRVNSNGEDMSDYSVNKFLADSVINAKLPSSVYSIVNGSNVTNGLAVNVLNPSTNNTIGTAYFANNQTINQALQVASNGFNLWNKTPAQQRAQILLNMANKLQENTANLVAILSNEAGKTLKDAILEIREAVDFLRYYAHKSSYGFANPIELPSVDGERNYMYLEGRGVFFCISPWNFPLAIFTGQIAAALVSGNTVVAKPAESTNVIAYYAVNLFLQAGLPAHALQLVLGKGDFVGNIVLNSPLLNGGVVFTGSDTTAKLINKTLANKQGAILPFIAETGGQNCMIVDSSALTEQVARDVVASAFQSAGQRCSALRVLYLQNEIADKTIEMIKGMAEILVVDDPWKIETEVGPIINATALQNLNNHVANFSAKFKILCKANITAQGNGNFFSPIAFEINDISALQQEIFGPVLHIIRFDIKNLQNIIQQINSTNYGLTFAVHSRVQDQINTIINSVACGNIYVNRNQIGATVSSQPFGGRGKSGTGPKAGGPFYLHKFATEKTVTIDVTAAGGNADLLAKV